MFCDHEYNSVVTLIYDLLKAFVPLAYKDGSV